MNRKNTQVDRIERILNSVARQQQEFAKHMQRLETAQAKTNDEIDKLRDEIDKLRAAQAKTDEQLKQTDKEIDKVNKMVGNLTSGWGKFVEGMVEPSVVRWVAEDLKLKLRGIMRNMALYKDNQLITEIDLLIEGIKDDGNSFLVIVEAKSDFGASDMRRFKKLVANLFNYLPPHYGGLQLQVAVAAMRFGNGVKTDALKAGFYVFEPEDNIMKLTKPRKPKIFGT